MNSLTSLFKALTDETRLRCFRVLAKSPVSLCVAEIADIMQRPQYAVSHALAILRKANLVQEERKGKLVFYQVSPLVLQESLGAWVIFNCDCTSDVAYNTDGSLQPGGKGCAYDLERLSWRIAMRQNDVIRTSFQQPSDPKNLHKRRVLFVCVHNSARSQLAEAWLNALAGDQYIAESAGLDPGSLNPWVVRVLAEQGIDISGKPTRSVVDVYRSGLTYHWVVTVCSREAEERCPVFPGPVRRLSWPFPDPSTFKGTDAEIMQQVRSLSSTIREQIQRFIDDREGPQDDKNT